MSFAFVIPGTALIRPHLGYFAASHEAYNTNTSVHQKRTEKQFRGDVRCTLLQVALRIFVVLFGILGLRRFGGRTNPQVFIDPRRWTMDKFGR